MQIAPLAAAVTDFRRLVALTHVGSPVAPVIATLDHAVRSLDAARPALEQTHASATTLDAVDRAQGGAATLRNALAELQANDGMTKFDPSFAADDPAWDANFSGWADALQSAAATVSAGWDWNPQLGGWVAAGTHDFSHTPPAYRSLTAWRSATAEAERLVARAHERVAEKASQRAHERVVMHQLDHATLMLAAQAL
ncbi:MAG: hypothetical protein JWN41_127 [Thermoleophilia bacterium]|nr:hypothetical protein [Thermoleophilia bacterium]